jgi:hypothetical protein
MRFAFPTYLLPTTSAYAIALGSSKCNNPAFIELTPARSVDYLKVIADTMSL